MNACDWAKWLGAISIVGVMCVGAQAADKNKVKGDGGKAGVFDDGNDAPQEEEFGVGNKDKPEGGKKKAPKGEKVADDEPPPGDKPADAKEGDGKEDGFGAGQAAKNEKKDKGLDPADLEADKDLAAYVKRLKKQFKKEDGYYLVTTIEMGMQPDPDAAKDKDAKLTYKKYRDVKFEVLDGQDSAIAFVVEFLGKYNPPWEKKAKGVKATRVKREAGDTPAPPLPQREFQVLSWFPASEQGLAQAEAARTAAQLALDEAARQQEERNKPANRNAR